MEMVREIELDHAAADVWRLLNDPDELAGWVGDEIRSADVLVRDHALAWTWSPDGVESTVEVTLTEVDQRTVVRVVERSAAGTPTASARACTKRWDDALLTLELKALTWQHRLVRG